MFCGNLLQQRLMHHDVTYVPNNPKHVVTFYQSERNTGLSTCSRRDNKVQVLDARLQRPFTANDHLPAKLSAVQYASYPCPTDNILCYNPSDLFDCSA